MRPHIKLKTFGSNESVRRNIPREYQKLFPKDSVLLNTDADGYITFPGFIKRENSLFMLGDSFIECSYVPEGQRISDILNLKYGERLNLSFYNAGMSGSSLLHLYNLYINKIANIPNSSVILFPGSISASCLVIQGGFWSRHSIYSNLTDQKEKAVWRGPRSYENFLRVLRLFKSSAEIFGTKLFLALTPYNRVAMRESSRPYFDSMHSIIRNFAESEGAPLLDLFSHPEDNSEYFYDELHVVPSGAAHYAERIGEFLLASFGGREEKS